MNDQAAHPDGSDEWLALVFEARVRRGLLDSHVPHPERPVLVLLGGQPAAGKTQAQRTVLAEHPGDDPVEVTGNGLRVFHPDDPTLARDDAFLMADATAPVSTSSAPAATPNAPPATSTPCSSPTWKPPSRTTSGASTSPSTSSSPSAANTRRQETRLKPVTVEGLNNDVLVDPIERYGNRRPRVERLVAAWNQELGDAAEPAGEPDDPLVESSTEPRRRPRTRPTTEEVDAMRTARANDVNVTILARQFGVHRGTVWAKTRDA